MLRKKQIFNTDFVQVYSDNRFMYVHTHTDFIQLFILKTFIV